MKFDLHIQSEFHEFKLSKQGRNFENLRSDIEDFLEKISPLLTLKPIEVTNGEVIPLERPKRGRPPKINSSASNTYAPIELKESYDINSDKHKNLMARWLDKNMPDWKDSETIEHISNAISGMNGWPFKDENGNVLDTFINEFKSRI